jgi:hypothetical protein
MKLKPIHEEMHIQVTPQRLWEVLSHFGDVYRFHGGVVDSHAETGSNETAGPGCERVCHIVDMGLKITLKERIIDYVEGRSYKFEVYEWKNFPLRKMLFGFTILDAGPTGTKLAIDIEYRAKPAWLTPLMAPKMRRLAKDVLLGYRHFAETGERRVPIKTLKKRYHGGALKLAGQN